MPGENSTPSRWTELWAIPAIAAIMWAAWVSPLLHLAVNNPLMQPTGLVVPGWWLLTLLLVPLLIQRLDIRPRWALALFTLIGLAAIPATWWIASGTEGASAGAWLIAQLRALTQWDEGVPSGLVLALAAVLAWRRGIAVSALRYDGLWRGFVGGSIALGSTMLLRADTLASVPGVDMTVSIVAFVLSGLVGLALMALTGTLAVENMRSTAHLGISRSWVAVAGSTVAIILALGWAAGLVFAPDTVASLLRYLKPIVELIFLGLVGLGTLIAYALLWVIQPLLQSAYRRLLPILQRDDLGRLREFLLEDVRIGQREPPDLGPLWEATWRPIFVLGGLALATWLIIRAWRSRERTDAGGIIETRESLLTAGLVRAQLKSLLRRRKPGATYLPLDAAASTRDAIREVYQTLLVRAREAGAPRRRDITPAVYERELVLLWPQHAAAFAVLTRLYVRARYGPDDPKESDVLRARQALADLAFEEQKRAARN